jgi:poly(3-hydroxybutyrate) depolymerase
MSSVPSLGGIRMVLPGGRSYVLAGGTGARRLVVGLHGTAHDASNANATFWSAPGGWQAHAAARGYQLALAEGLSGRWNAGGGWPGGEQDDVAYLLEVVADATSHVPADEVYIAGFSAGGAMAWRAAVLHPEVFTAAGSASGWAPIYPTAPVDYWHIHGTGDTTVPIRGGKGVYDVVFPPTDDEARLAPRGSRVVLYATGGGHATPGWMAERLWQFWTVDRARP